MDEAESLSHSKRECKYRVVFIPKCRCRILCEQLRRHLGEVFHELARYFVGQHFWARGYYVSTVGCDERVIRAYIRHQEAEDQRLEQLNLWR